MTHSEKKLFKDGIVIPLIAAIIIAAAAMVVLLLLKLPYDGSAAVSSTSQINEITDFAAFSGDSAKRSDIGEISGNTLIGEINIGDTTYPLIYDADNVNALGKFNINKTSRLVGENGCCIMEIYKNDSAKLKLLAAGDVITVETFYSSYEFKVTKTCTLESENELKAAGAGSGRSIALYTDGSVGNGIGGDYYVCIAEMVSGVKINA